MLGPFSQESIRQLISKGIIVEGDFLAVIGQTFRPLATYVEFQKVTHFRPYETQDAPRFQATRSASDSLEAVPQKAFFYRQAQSSKPPEVANYVGQLERVSFSRLLYFFHTRRQTGRLLIQNPQNISREIYFVDGQPESIQTPSEGDALSRHLIATRVCSPHDLEQARLMCEHNGGSLGDVLVARGVLHPYQLFEILQTLFFRCMNDSFSWEEGRYLFFSGQTSGRNHAPLNVDCLDLIKRGIYASYKLWRLKWHLEPYYNYPITPVSNPNVDINALRFSPREARIFHLLRQRLTLWEVIQEVEQARVADTLEIHCFLLFLGHIELCLFNHQVLGGRVQDEIRMLAEAGAAR